MYLLVVVFPVSICSTEKVASGSAGYIIRPTSLGFTGHLERMLIIAEVFKVCSAVDL